MKFPIIDLQHKQLSAESDNHLLKVEPPADRRALSGGIPEFVIYDRFSAASSSVRLEQPVFFNMLRT